MLAGESNPMREVSNFIYIFVENKKVEKTLRPIKVIWDIIAMKKIVVIIFLLSSTKSGLIYEIFESSETFF